jgi:hypothetical protein
MKIKESEMRVQEAEMEGGDIQIIDLNKID